MHSPSPITHPAPSNRHRAHGPRGAKYPVVRWSALATGSLAGIAAWAFAYVLGAVVATACGLFSAGAATWGQLLLGIYGAVSASLALALAAYMAARTGGAHTEENALMYGLCLWSMSTITLVAVSAATLAGMVPVEMVERVPMLAVGLAAVGLVPGGPSAPTVATLASMLATLILSLWVALWGAGRARDVTGGGSPQT